MAGRLAVIPGGTIHFTDMPVTQAHDTGAAQRCSCCNWHPLAQQCATETRPDSLICFTDVGARQGRRKSPCLLLLLQVAFGTLVQLMLEGDDAEFDRVLRFNQVRLILCGSSIRRW